MKTLAAVVFLLACALAIIEASEKAQTLPINVDFQNQEFTAYINANIGTPAQSVNLSIDFFTTSSYVVDKDAKVNCDGKQLFDYGKSTSFKLLKNYTEKYDSNYLVEDVIQFADSTSTKRQFNLTNDYPTDWQCNPYNGALGLGVVSNSDSLIAKTLKDYPQQVLTISPSDAKASPPQLSLTIGGQNDNQCKSDWTEASCGGSSQFTYPACTFDVNGYSFGTYTMKRTYSIGSASLSLQQLTYVPDDVYSRVMRGVTYNETNSGIPCDSHPDLSIFINKQQYTLDGKHYVGKELGNGWCEFLIYNGKQYGLDENLFVLPLGFFANNCQRIDYAKLSMALASAK